MNIPELGIGIIYFTGFEEVIQSNPDLIQVIEIEPQTFWYRRKSGLDCFTYDKQVAAYLLGLNRPLIFHGVGFPVAGSIGADPVHLPCLHGMIEELQPQWISEHLSYNTILVDQVPCNTNFLLPPLQTRESVQHISRSIREYASKFSIPFAFETGVNYLSPKEFELQDGEFINQVAQASDCNILLDIHNILANELNGRQKIGDFIKQIDLERVVEIHLAGGFYFDNYYLDSHSNVSSREVLDVFGNIVKQLPHLKAITFEMLPDYLPFVPKESMRKQLEKMNSIWDKRGSKTKKRKTGAKVTNKPTSWCPGIYEWESTLGLLAINRKPQTNSPLVEELENDKGLSIIRKLIEKFRGSLVVSSLHVSCRYIMLRYNVEALNALLYAFWKDTPPKLFASDNGLDFADYLLSCDQIKEDRLLYDLVKYEKSSILTLLDEQRREVEMSFNPVELMPYLADKKLPPNLVTGKYIIEILPQTQYNEYISTVFHS